MSDTKIGGNERLAVDCPGCKAELPEEIEAQTGVGEVVHKHHVRYCPICGERVSA